MIHISSNFYLSESEDLTGKPIIGYQSILTINNVSADSNPDETPIVNLVNEQTDQYWISDSTDEQFIYFNNTEVEVIDYIGIARHNFGSGQIEYQLQYSEDGGSWSDVFSSLIPSNDNAIIHFFDERDYGFFRLRIIPGGIEPRIAHIKLGKILVLQRAIYVGHRPITLNRITEKVSLTAEDGSFLGRIVKRRSLKTSVSFKNIEPDFYRSYVDAFAQHAETGTFFWAWKPVKYPNEVGYGWVEGDIGPENSLPNGMIEFGFQMQAVA